MEGKLKAALTETLRRHVNRRDEREIFRVEVLNVLKENWASLRLEKFEIVENCRSRRLKFFEYIKKVN